MKILLSFLTQPTIQIWKYSFAIFPIAVLPSVALVALVHLALWAAEVDANNVGTLERTSAMSFFVGAVIFAPLVETLLLSVVLEVLSKLSKRTLFVATVSALFWGLLHGAVAVLWFFGTVWSFFVFSCAYLGWRRRSVKSALIVAWLPHVLINLSVFVVIYLATESFSAA